MATIRKRSWRTPGGAERAAWIVSYSLAGRRHIKTFELKKAAEQWRAQTLHEIARGVHAPASTSITVEKAAEMWLTQCRTDGLEAATLAQYEQHCRLHILPLLGDPASRPQLRFHRRLPQHADHEAEEIAGAGDKSHDQPWRDHRHGAGGRARFPQCRARSAGRQRPARAKARQATRQAPRSRCRPAEERRAAGHSEGH